MKLFSKYNRINIPATILIFLVGCVGFYFVLREVLIRQLDASLRTEKTEICSYVSQHNALPEVVNTRGQQTSFTGVPSPVNGVYRYSEKQRGPAKGGYSWRRLVVFGINAGGRNYKVVVSQSQVEAEYLLGLIIFIAAGVIALVLVTSVVINGWVLRRLWRPFYHTVGAMGSYELARQELLQLRPSDIDEFNLLNQSVHGMTERIQHDYQIVKEFSANAAHEMQTPLAVIRTRTDELIQDEHFLQQHEQAILTIEQSVQRLTRMNQALLLLARIENRQFVLNEEVALDELIKEKLQELSELIASQRLRVTVNTVPVTVRFHRYLAEVILNNLLSNAIRYNYQQGEIVIVLNAAMLSIGNSSPLPSMDGEKLWQRFYRHPESLPDGNGLGLSIVKQTCEWAGYEVNYRYHDGLHIFSIALLGH